MKVKRNVQSEEGAKVMGPKLQTHKRFKRTLFIRTRQNQQILGEIPFAKLQNDI